MLQVGQKMLPYFVPMCHFLIKRTDLIPTLKNKKFIQKLDIMHFLKRGSSNKALFSILIKSKQNYI